MTNSNSPMVNSLDKYEDQLDLARQVNAENRYFVALSGDHFDIERGAAWSTEVRVENLKDYLWANAFLVWQNDKFLLSTWGGFQNASNPASTSDPTDSFTARYPEDIELTIH